jgi:hypothetical protein
LKSGDTPADPILDLKKIYHHYRNCQDWKVSQKQLLDLFFKARAADLQQFSQLCEQVLSVVEGTSFPWCIPVTGNKTRRP